MLPKKNIKIQYLVYLPLFLAMLFHGVPAYAVDVLDATANLSATDMIANFAKQLPNLMRLVTAIAYVIGMVFIISGVIKLKHAGEMRMQMSPEHSIKGPIILIVIGAMLLYLPSSVQIGMSSFWTEPNPYGYTQDKDQWAQFFNNIFMVVQLFGVIAFIRGLVLLASLNHHGQPGTFGRGMTHIIGGILCINIYQFVHVVMITFGIDSLLG